MQVCIHHTSCGTCTADTPTIPPLGFAPSCTSHHIHTIHTHHVHTIHTMYTPYTHDTHTTCTPYTHTMYTPHAQICVDVFVLAQTYVDIASIGQLCKATGGQLYQYSKFDARSDNAQLFNDLRWNLTRPQVGWVGCMCVWDGVCGMACVCVVVCVGWCVYVGWCVCGGGWGVWEVVYK